MTLLTSDPCETGDHLCKYVMDTTDNTWLAGAANWLIAKPAAILGLLLAALVIRWVVARLVDRVAGRAATGLVPERPNGKRVRGGQDATAVRQAAARRAQRAQTMASVLKSISSFVIFSIVVIMAIDVLGYDVGPLVAGAGIVGLALGFGAQSLVKDFLSGLFMTFEDQLGVGDVVNLNDVTGKVEAVTLRVTRIRAEDGTVWYVRNGEILKVGNRSQT
jgi:moderate conductance mechanosensitive channel